MKAYVKLRLLFMSCLCKIVFLSLLAEFKLFALWHASFIGLSAMKIIYQRDLNRQFKDIYYKF